MKRFFAHVAPRIGHLSDETISMLVSGELSSVREPRALAHLANCWQCRGRRDAFEKAALQVVEYRKARLDAELPLDPDRRTSFLSQLDQALEQSASGPSWPRMFARIGAFRVPNMNPIFASAAVVCIAVIALLCIWQRSTPRISPSGLLEEAVAHEQTNPATAQPGVIYQEVRITAANHTLVRQLYRDRQEKRKIRPERVSSDVSLVRARLLEAGVDWSAPLSAISYKDWHDRQPVFTDRVTDSGSDLLTLTTSIPTGEIASESMTLRQDDFHPVKRRIETRGQGTIEIAELNYAVLGWNAVNASLFEGEVPSSPSIANTHPVMFHALPTPEQIDEAELEARIVLNQTRADTQDQIAISNSDMGVVVKGIVPTNQQKRVLVSSLREIPYVHPNILSTEELSAKNVSEQSEPTNAPDSQTYSNDQPSPLASYIQQQGLSQDQLNQVSQRLLDGSLTVQQGAAQISTLLKRFSSTEELDAQARTNLQNLIVGYSGSIVSGLNEEISALKQVGIDHSPVQNFPGDTTPSDADALRQAALQNQLLCQEMITASLTPPRTAVMIAADLQLSILRIHSALTSTQKQLQ